MYTLCTCVTYLLMYNHIACVHLVKAQYMYVNAGPDHLRRLLQSQGSEYTHYYSFCHEYIAMSTKPSPRVP